MDKLLICRAVRDTARFREWLEGSYSLNFIDPSQMADSENIQKLSAIVLPNLVIRADGDDLQLVKWISRGQMCPVCLDLRVVALRARANSKCSRWLTFFAKEAILSIIDKLENSGFQAINGFNLHLPNLTIALFRLEPYSTCPLCANTIDDNAAQATIQLVSRTKKCLGEYHLVNTHELNLDSAAYIGPACGMLGSEFIRYEFQPFNVPVGGTLRELQKRPACTGWLGRKNSFRSSFETGLLEAFERYSALELRSKRCVVVDCYKNLKACAIDPRECGLYERQSYEQDPGLSAFSDDIKIRWVWGYSLTEHRSVLVPLQLAYYADRDPEEPLIVRNNSNGSATGSCLEEAIFFALLELIERDAFMIHWLARLSPRKIDPASLESVNVRLLMERIYRSGLNINLLDTRLDIPIPSITAVVTKTSNEFGAVSVSAGCNFNPEQAIESALAEAACAQYALQEQFRSREAVLRLALSDFSRIQTGEDHKCFYGLPEAFALTQFLLASDLTVGFEEAYTDWRAHVPRTLNLLDDIHHCLTLIQSAGLKQAIVVDQSSPEGLRAGLRTARLLVPGLVPIDFGYGQCRGITLERLYSVPVKLGYRQRRMTPDEVNRIPHPFY